MTPEEVSQLKIKIETQLTPEQKKGILPIIKAEVMQQQMEHNKNGVKQGGGTTFEFQLDKLTPKTARELEAYVNQMVNLNKKKQKRKDTDKARRAKAQAAKEQQRQRDALAAQQKAREAQLS